MDKFFIKLKEVKTIKEAKEKLFSLVDKKEIDKAVQFCIKAHNGQFRKSGEAYSIHPILVAFVVANFSDDKSMVIASLLHDVVEDTEHTIEDIKSEFGEDVAIIVEGLTKIVEIREEELTPSSSDEKLIKSALTFRKILLASIEDIRVLVIKLCDRVHNMLTLEALPANKQKRIAEETLVVYAPIAHRLGISKLKNLLEDLSFHYVFPNEYEKIDKYLKSNSQKMQLKLNSFISKIEKLLLNHGFIKSEIEILSRVKHLYSTYLKMQRKGVTLEEVLDLLAIRILVKEPLDCYKVLGIIHSNFKPLIARFKDYISVPKENGYQTIHSTVFSDSSIFEIQIRTFEMHKTAEFGVAAHWKYKSGGLQPNLDWLHKMEYKNDDVEEFYELVKNDLYSEDIVIYSPKGDVYTLPRGATALDFAYEIHSEIGDKAKFAYIDKIKSSLLTELKSGSIVKIVTNDELITRCTWQSAVKTSKAKTHIKINCNHRLKEIDSLVSINILEAIFKKDFKNIRETLDEEDIVDNIYKGARDLVFLKDVKNRLKNIYKKDNAFLELLQMMKLKLKRYKFDNIIIYSNHSISDVSFDYCCHPKKGDLIVAFKKDNKAVIHHKLCTKAIEKIKAHEPMLYVEWEKKDILNYKAIVSLENKKGELAKFLQYLANIDINLLRISLGNENEDFATYCIVEFESPQKDIKVLRERIESKVKVIELLYLNDAYFGI